MTDTAVVDYFETAKQEDIDWGVTLTVKRNPAGGQLSATQVGVHSMGRNQASTTGTWDPGGTTGIAPLGTESTTLVVPGATVGDFTLRSFSSPLGGLFLFAEVTAVNTVTVTLFNPTTATVNPVSGTLKVLVVPSR